MTRTLRLAGCTIALELDPRLDEALLPWLAHFAAGEPAIPGVARWSFRVVVPAEIAPLPPGAIPLVDYYYVSGVRDGDRLLFRGEDGSRASFDPATGEVAAQVPESAVGSPPWIVRDLFSALLTALLRRHGRFPIHAAAVQSPDEAHALLIVGPPMSGKTSLAINLLRRGFSLLSDDKAILFRDDAPGAAVRMAGLFRAANVDPALACHFPELADLLEQAPAHPHSPKRQLRLDDRYAEARGAAPRVTRLLFPRVIDAGPSVVEAIAPREALIELLHQSPTVRDPRDAAPQLRLLGALADAAPAFRLRLGRDILEDDARLPAIGAAIGIPIGAPQTTSRA